MNRFVSRPGNPRKLRHSGLLAFGTVLLLTCCSLLSLQAREPILRVGIISDIHGRPGKTTDRGQLALQQVLKQLKARHIDVLIIGGDIANDGQRRVYEEYREIMPEIFGDHQPEQILIMGNHDYWNGMAVPDAQENFRLGLNLPSIYCHKVIKGYDFIGVSPDYKNAAPEAYRKEAIGFMKKALAAAIQRDPGKPIFVVTHQPASHTVYGSEENGNDAVGETLKPYQQVFLIAGHSHFPLEDERSIHQQDFTSVNTSSLAYCGLEEGKVNQRRGMPVDAWKCRQYLYLEIHSDSLIVRRYSIDGEEIKADHPWIVPLPLKKENFIYTSARRANRIAPEFPAKARATVSFPQRPYKNLVLRIDAAHHNDFVHSYRVAVQQKDSDGTWRAQDSFSFFSDFYCGLKAMQDPFRVVVPGAKFPVDTTYRFQVFPVESFGKEGKNPLEIEFTTPARKATVKF